MMSYINETDFVIENKELVYPEIITDGLQLYYDAKGKRDTDYHRDTMLDMSGNKNHGELQNFAYEKHSGYKDGLVFDYIDDKLVRPALNLKPDDLTFMLNGNIISFSPDETVKRVQDGEVIESKGFNIVRNGDIVLPNHPEWRQSNSLEYSINKNEITIIGKGSPTGTGGNWFALNTISPPNDNSIYYITALAKGQGQAYIGVSYNVDSLYLNDSFRRVSYVGKQIANNHVNGLAVLGGNLDDIVTFKEVMAINLTETFGAGNEPTKEQMNEIINRFGFIPNAQDLIDRIEYKGNDLGDMENIIDGLYKTGVLSGEEIYTDKADDDGVVHVDVDGKSVGGGENNLISKSDIENWNGVINWKNDIVSVQTTGSAGVRIPSSVFEINQKYTLSFKARLISGTVYGIMGHALSFDALGYQDGNSLGSWSGKVTSTQEELIIGKEYNYKINLTKTRDGDWLYIQPNRADYGVSYKLELYDFQLNAGDDSLKYNGLSPTPDYPNKIHSLNDFDVVSSVGNRNIILNSSEPMNGFSQTTGLEASVTTEGYYKVVASEGNGNWFYPTALYAMRSNGQIQKNFNVGDVFTFSVDIKSPDSTDIPSLYVSGATGAYIMLEGEMGTKFSRFYITSTWRNLSDMNLALGLSGRSGTFIFRRMKIEKGPVHTPWTPAQEEIIESSNHPLIDKINLLLDEPLRNVGDIKDRLFRDSDGIWKIERNTKEVYFGKNLKPGADVTHSETPDGLKEYFISGYSTIKMSGNTTHINSTHFAYNRETNSRSTAKLNHVGMNGPSGRWAHNLQFVVSEQEFPTLESFNNWLIEQENSGTPVKMQVQLKPEDIYTEILSQSEQDKLNNLRSFEDSNYVYTVLTNEDNYLSKNFKPTLHAKFLYNNWYKEDRVINNLMIYSRALTNEEMLQNYKTIKRRWGM